MVAPVNQNVDGNNVRCVFDQTNADIIVRVSGLELEVFSEEPIAKDPPFLNQDADIYLKESLPPGTILPFSSQNIPDEFLECDGSEHLISSFPDLHSVIGFKFGGNAAK